MTGSMPSVFSYRHGVLHVEEVPVTTLARDVGTPFYVYSTRRLRENYAAFAGPLGGLNATVHFANKAAPNIALMRVLAEAGAGADITSIGELERALEAGVAPTKIIFSGVGKTRSEIMAALLAGIYQINAESIPELHQIAAVATEMNGVAPIALRVNPDVIAGTNAKIATGHKGAKFGIDLDQLDDALRFVAAQPSLRLCGLSMHVGSHVTTYDPFREAFAVMADLVRSLRARGLVIERLDLGGGVGIDYDGDAPLDPFDHYVEAVRTTVGSLGCALAFEPGRRLVGDAGLLIARVTYRKESDPTTFLILDAGMNDLVRPAMYGARHGIVPVDDPLGRPSGLAAVVGPICESSDLFGEHYALPRLEAGDLVALLQAGAYGAAMASTYNGRALIPEVLVNNDDFALIRRRLSVAEQIAWESNPAWLAPARQDAPR
jgi:diaminopimelate decarboxylase